ncbi:MAG: phosphoribosylamine--glycine ligase [Thermoleophilia bacterium]
MKVLVVGSGGREHALCWKLSQSPLLTELHAAPGSPGIGRLGTCHPVRVQDVAGLVDLCEDLRIDLAVIGPEAPLVAGLADELRRAGIAVFGPSAAAAQIEGSKSFAKDVMTAAGVPTARALDEAIAPCVVKADGLAAGKGVFVCTTQAEAEDALFRARALGGETVIEELLQGEEVSLFALCDGVRAIPLPAAQDYKRIRDGDRGPNTGGMGSFSPAPIMPPDLAAELVRQVHEPVLAELAERDAPFVGLLYAGLMLTPDGVRVLEFNCRFGDPETQSILPLIEGDLLEALRAAANGDLSGVELASTPEWSVTVVLASRGYPDSSESGIPIRGLDRAEATGALVFHAGTALREGEVISAGGRVLNVTATGATAAEARDRAYAAVAEIDFPGSQHRTDIALKAVRADG